MFHLAIVIGICGSRLLIITQSFMVPPQQSVQLFTYTCIIFCCSSTNEYSL